MSVLDTLVQERAKFGARITPAQAVEILNAVAWTHQPDVGLFAAPVGGNGWPHPRGFVRLDILAHKADGHIYDVFIDGPDASQNYAGEARPAWQDKGALDPSRFVTPVKPIALPAPADPPAPGQPPAPADPAPDQSGALEAIALLLPLIEQFVGAAEALVTEAQKQNDCLARLEKDGVRVRLR